MFCPLFTAPSFRTFSMLACGFLAQSGKRTVCGMLTGADLSRAWSHDRAHYFFSRARWNPDDLGIAVAGLVIALLVPDGEPVEVLIDDTLFRRRGKRVWAASWSHDGSALGPAKKGYGNNWVVLAVRVRLPVVSRPVAVPVMAKLVIKGSMSASRLWLARRMVTRLAAKLTGRTISVTADSAYAGEELKQLPPGVTWTTRLRSSAALHGLPPERTGKKGRPRLKGDRLPCLAKTAAAAEFSQVTVTRYGKTETIAAHAFTCRWYSVTGTVPVTVILIRDKSKTGYDLALVTTEKGPDTARVIERYAARWAIEVAIEDAKQLFGTGQARNRTAAAVERTVPFMLACQALAVCWYATAGHHPADAEARRRNAPWYTAKTEPSTADMTAKLRRVIIAAKFKRVRADQPEPAEIHAIRLAWEDAEDPAAKRRKSSGFAAHETGKLPHQDDCGIGAVAEAAANPVPDSAGRAPGCHRRSGGLLGSSPVRDHSKISKGIFGPIREDGTMEITEQILADHHEQRRMFALLDELGNEPARLAPVWARLVILLEVHADAEERLFYPRLLEVGVGADGAAGAQGETKDAIRDHDDIRDGIRRTRQHPVGSSDWWQAVSDTRIANSDHMAEEEREALADFRQHAAYQARHDLGTAFAVYEAAHASGIPLADQDPDSYVRDHSR